MLSALNVQLVKAVTATKQLCRLGLRYLALLHNIVRICTREAGTLQQVHDLRLAVTYSSQALLVLHHITQGHTLCYSTILLQHVSELPT